MIVVISTRRGFFGGVILTVSYKHESDLEPTFRDMTQTEVAVLKVHQKLNEE